MREISADPRKLLINRVKAIAQWRNITNRAPNEAADSARRAVTTATELYRQGVTDFLSVIDAERSLASAEDNLAQSDRTICINLIALDKSLGGGWQIDPTIAVAQASCL